jgi:hypothetical protein
MFNIPKSIVAGDSKVWFDRFSQYPPAESWELSYAIRGESTLDVVGNADGEDFVCQISSTSSSNLSPGIYHWQAYISMGMNRTTIGNGAIEVIQDLASTNAGYDGRTEAQKLLGAVEAAIAAIAKGEMVQSYSIKGRSLSKYSLTELIQLRDRLKGEVARENARKQGRDNRTYIQFWNG